MSTSVNPSRSRASLRRASALPRPRLTVVPQGRVPGAAAAVRRCWSSRVLAAGLVGLLLLNTSLERGAYQVDGAAAAVRRR